MEPKFKVGSILTVNSDYCNARIYYKHFCGQRGVLVRLHPLFEDYDGDDQPIGEPIEYEYEVVFPDDVLFLSEEYLMLMEKKTSGFGKFIQRIENELS